MKNLVKVSIFALALGFFASCETKDETTTAPDTTTGTEAAAPDTTTAGAPDTTTAAPEATAPEATAPVADTAKPH